MPEPSQELEVVRTDPSQGVVHPVTGEMLDLSDTTDILAGALDDVRRLEGDLRDFKSALSMELLRRMDYYRTYTAHLRGFGKVSGDGPRKPDYDGRTLRTGLLKLVTEVLPQEAVDAAVEAVVEWKVKKAGVNALLRVEDERVLAAVKAAEVPNTKPRAVRVERARSTS